MFKNMTKPYDFIVGPLYCTIIIVLSITSSFDFHETSLYILKFVCVFLRWLKNLKLDNNNLIHKFAVLLASTFFTKIQYSIKSAY